MSLDRPRIHPVAFLCPEDAAFITGADLAVNGGRAPATAEPANEKARAMQRGPSCSDASSARRGGCLVTGKPDLLILHCHLGEMGNASDRFCHGRDTVKWRIKATKKEARNRAREI
ncbi:hypothetical protein [Ralstonia pseudosolanacearum]|uniref:hypothetical protein n=2 Tax=Ralstonia pseudosolanacearum TaxID=1310165 RepID=UPI001C8B1B4D|nr:hypothetical protein [Ralstonia pseudosolanacearum]MBX9429050.1 hypothetical protein [Ralstonia pseudosolanacearum]